MKENIKADFFWVTSYDVNNSNKVNERNAVKTFFYKNPGDIETEMGLESSHVDSNNLANCLLVEKIFEQNDNISFSNDSFIYNIKKDLRLIERIFCDNIHIQDGVEGLYVDINPYKFYFPCYTDYICNSFLKEIDYKKKVIGDINELDLPEIGIALSFFLNKNKKFFESYLLPLTAIIGKLIIQDYDNTNWIMIREHDNSWSPALVYNDEVIVFGLYLVEDYETDGDMALITTYTSIHDIITINLKGRRNK